MNQVLIRLRNKIVAMYDALPGVDKVLIHHRESGADVVDATGGWGGQTGCT